MIQSLVDQLEADGFILEESQVFREGGPRYWHASLVNKDGFPVSGGFGADPHYARKVALAEFLERREVDRIRAAGDAERRKWGLDRIPTACGFDLHNSVARSVQEATERWVMSLWIDDHYLIEELDASRVATELDPISAHLHSLFDSVRFFKKEVLVDLGREFQKVVVGQTMGFKDKGIFPGSSAQTTGGSLWQHSLLESYRHVLAFRNNPAEQRGRFPSNKVDFFAERAELATRQIEKSRIKNWPQPKILLHHHDPREEGRYFLARTILDGWTSWDQGPVDRFLY